MDYNEYFPDRSPDSVTVTFAAPVTALPQELRKWFDEHVHHTCEVKTPGNGAIFMSALFRKPDERSSAIYRFNRWKWILRRTAGFRDEVFPLVVNFENKQEALLFKMTWG